MNTFLVDSFWTEPPTTEEAPTRPVTSGKSKQKPEYPKEEEFSAEVIPVLSDLYHC